MCKILIMIIIIKTMSVLAMEGTVPPICSLNEVLTYHLPCARYCSGYKKTYMSKVLSFMELTFFWEKQKVIK